ncbi:MAG TPA: hypothetical protein VE396_18035 [Xanthobacteraceae bacterium]|nr:hypothetical protein [Xanthobacteraceae bacterium]
MPEIYPKVTRSKLKSGARKTSKGKGRVPLPGVKTDAKHVGATDKCGYQANRALAEMIKKAVQAKKNSDKHGQHFVFGWRLYPNKEHPRWNSKNDHA